MLFLTSGIYKGTGLVAWIPVDVTLLTAAATFAAGVVVLARLRGAPTEAVIAVVLWALFFAWVATTFVWTTGVEVGNQRVLTELPLVGLAFAGGALIVSRSESRLVRFLRLFAAFGVVLVLITFATALTPGGQSVTDASNYIPRGVALAIGAVVMFAESLIPGRRWWFRIVIAGVGAIYTFAVLEAGSRQALIALLLAMPLLAVFGWRVNVRHRSFLLLATICAAIVAVVGVVRYSTQLATLQRLQIVLAGRMGSSLQTRSEHLRDALMGFGEAPMFGHGIASFGQLYGSSLTDYPHDIIAEVLFETGFVGFILLAIAATVTLAPLLQRNVQISPFARCITYCAVIIVGVSALVSGTYTENRLLFGIVGLSLVAQLRRPHDTVLD